MMSEWVQCRVCKKAIAGYEHRARFIFQGEERIYAGDSAVLDCGCEVPRYELEVDYSREPHEARMIDILRKTTVLTFLDSGPNNEILESVDCDE